MKKSNKLPIASTAGPVKPSSDDEARERRYKAEDALRAIQQVEKYKSDKALMKDVKSLAKEQVKTLSKVAGQ